MSLERGCGGDACGVGESGEGAEGEARCGGDGGTRTTGATRVERERESATMLGATDSCARATVLPSPPFSRLGFCMAAWERGSVGTQPSLRSHLGASSCAPL